MRGLRVAAALCVALLGAGGPCWSAPAGKWVRLERTHLPAGRDPSGIWSREIDAADADFRRAAGDAAFAKMGSHAPLNLESVSFASGPLSVRLEILLGAGLCESGANSKDATDLSSQCPAKVVVSRGGVVEPALDWKGCFVDVPDKRAPGDPDPRTNGAFAYFDASGSRLSVEAIQGGAPTPGCSRSIPIGETR